MTYPNPLFDTSFKIVMDDPELAPEILSALLQTEVKLVQHIPTDYQIKTQKQGGMHRLDYVAIIDVGGVPKKVLIELQRMEKYNDYKRFRRYLGHQMMSDHDDEILEIITIYLINFTVGIDAAFFSSPDFFINELSRQQTKKNRQDSDFSRYLQHKMYVVQLPILEAELQELHIDNQYVTSLKDLMKLWIDGAKNGAYLLESKEEDFKGLGQKVYTKLNIAYHSSQELRFKLEDEAKSAAELEKIMNRLAGELAIELAGELAIELADEKVKEAKAEADKKLYEANVITIKMMLEFGKPIDLIVEKFPDFTKDKILTFI